MTTAPVVRPSEPDAAALLPPAVQPLVWQARQRAGRADPWDYYFPVYARVAAPWYRRRWRWYVAVPISEGHLPGVFVEDSGQAWTQGAAVRAAIRAADHALSAPAVRHPDQWIERTRAVVLTPTVGAIIWAPWSLVFAFLGLTSWRACALVFLCAAVGLFIDHQLGRLKRARMRARSGLT